MRQGFIGRLLIVTIMAHCMFDFDLQFVSIEFVLLLALDWESGTAHRVGKKIPWLAMDVILAGISLWLGIALGLYRFGKYEAAVKVYPDCTAAWISMLAQNRDVDKMEQLADEILIRNESVSLAYSAKARAAYARGDFANMIEYKQKAISCSRYELEEYLDYFDMLYVGIRLYTENNDPESAEFCRQCLIEIPDRMERVLENTDEISWKIRDKPELTLPDQYQDRLRLLKK